MEILEFSLMIVLLLLIIYLLLKVLNLYELVLIQLNIVNQQQLENYKLHQQMIELQKENTALLTQNQNNLFKDAVQFVWDIINPTVINVWKKSA